MPLSPKDRRSLMILGGVAIVAAAVFFLVVVRGQKPSSPATTAPITNPAGSSQPSPTPSPTGKKKPAQALVFSGRDPFNPAQGGGTLPTTAAPTISPAGSPAPVPSGGSSTQIGGDTVTLVDIFTADGVQKAQIEVNGTVYTVAVGDDFGDGYTLESISGSCVNVSHGSASAGLCEVANK
jgi:hypothetical protein